MTSELLFTSCAPFMFGSQQMMCILLFTFCLQITLGCCQDFSIPSEWRKPTSSRSKLELRVVAQSVIEGIIPIFNGDVPVIVDKFGQTAQLYCAIALYDRLVSNSSYKGTVRSMLASVPGLYPGYYAIPSSAGRPNLDPLGWALAAMYAFHAYGDQGFVDIATSLWDEVNKYLITPQDFASGNLSLAHMSLTYASTCQTDSVVGGLLGETLYVVGPEAKQTLTMDAGTQCGFVALSTYLFEATSDRKYSDAASVTSAFFKAHLYNNSTTFREFLIYTNQGPPQCFIDHTQSPANPASLGLCLEAIGIYANVIGSSEWMRFLQEWIVGIIKYPTSDLTLQSGILKASGGGEPFEDEDGAMKAMESAFIRGMYVTWSRIEPTSAVARLIEAFITVQYNALLDLASEPDVYRFSWQWQGPPATQSLPWAQAAALSVLDAAIGLPPGSPVRVSSNPSESPTAATTTGQLSANLKVPDAHLIIGLSVAAASVLSAAIVLAFRVYRRRRIQYLVNKEDGREIVPSNSNSRMERLGLNGIEPFSLRQIPSENVNRRPQKSASQDRRSARFEHEKGTISLFSIEPRPTEPLQFDEGASQARDVATSDVACGGGTETSAPRPPSTSDNPTSMRKPELTIGTHANPVMTQDLRIPTQSLEIARGLDIDERDLSSTIPALIRRINRALARLPHSSQIPIEDRAELPPEYEEPLSVPFESIDKLFLRSHNLLRSFRRYGSLHGYGFTST
ncbi:hypothetical protein NLI96_g12102 [Meripilus lineatus]|uniref:Glycoside hydrolase family 76 protein n=1 Tax=Meripilus lineatus TaxID=2056292 RepID=A0AAD5UQP7_9APHY|nr:hypothetical protein NLI96_g12102 [Physisporinus lineatus]